MGRMLCAIIPHVAILAQAFDSEYPIGILGILRSGRRERNAPLVGRKRRAACSQRATTFRGGGG